MKTNKYIIILLSILLCPACTGYLEERPTTSLSETSVYSNAQLLEAGIRGIVSSFQSGRSMYLGDMQEYMQTGSCLTYFPQGTAGKNNGDERWSSSYHYTQASTTVLNNEIYTSHYEAVFRCNKLISGLADSPVDPDFKLEIEAEARFYRAVLYFALVRFYGDVPLILDVPASANDTDRPRTNYCAVYHQILEDLDFAWANMRDAARVMQVTPGEGRPDKWAALSFKVAVYCQMACLLEYQDDNFFDTSRQGRAPDFSADGIVSAPQAWTKALETARKVISESGYRLASRYSDLFTWDRDFVSEDGHGSWDLPERIFVLKQSVAAKYGQIARRTLPPYPEGTACTQKNSNYGRFRPTRFVFQKWCETYGGTKGTGTNNSGIYVTCDDPRLDVTMIHTKTVDLSKGKAYTLYPGNSAVLTASRQTFLPYFRKYLDPLYNADCGNSDFYYMRLAEVYLYAAEAAASLCATPADEYGQMAFGFIEALHRRARATVPGSVQPHWEEGRFATREELVNGIMWERVFELYGEGHEWFDTHRRGAGWFIENVIKPFNISLMAPEQAKARDWYGAQTVSPFSEDPSEVRKGLLCAFPQTEMMYNSAISQDSQNDFYWK